MTSRAAGIRYARALFDVARKEGDVQQAGQELTSFNDFVARHDALGKIFSNPAIPAPKKRAVVEQLTARAGSMSPVVRKLLLLLAERDRLVLLPDITASYQNRLMEHAKVVRAEIVTAIGLPADRVASLQQGLAQATGRQVQLESRVDPAIIGGAIARVGSTVYDGSVTRQLQKMKEALSGEGAS
jgi:F-type H+-transporting ATPase subunit delta